MSEEKRLVDNPALCELLSGDVASLVGVNLRNKPCVTCFFFFAFILFLLTLSLFCSDLRLCVVLSCEITYRVFQDTLVNF